MSEPRADLVITGARVWTGTDDLTGPPPEHAEEAAVAVRDGVVQAVGPDGDVLELAGPATRRLHLPGRLVVPGFQDAHVHPAFAGRYRIHLSLHELDGVEAYLLALRRYAAGHPDLPWVYGAGWAPESMPGTADARTLLDSAVPDRPVFLFDSSIHSAMVNSRALELAGLDAATPDPADGRYRRHPATGELTGVLDEGAAYAFEARHLPAPDLAEWRRAILDAQAHLHVLGITGWQDAWVTPRTQAAYASLADDGRLSARVVAALWWDRERGLEQVDELVERRAEAWRDGRLLPRSVKIMLDGVIENGTAAMLRPFLDPAGAERADTGLIYVEPDLLAAAVTRLDRLDFQVHLHTIGDRAVRVGLDAVEAALAANGPRGNRHHLAHLQVITPQDVPRFAALGAVANCQAYWAQHEPMMDELTIPVLGADRSLRQYPFAELAAAGAVLAMGSDWAVSTPDPLRQIEVAVTRVDPDDRDRAPFLPEQRLTLAQAMRAFTAGSAFVDHDPRAGVVRAGMRADLAVLDRDVLAADHSRVADARVEYTLAAGALVHSPHGPSGSD